MSNISATNLFETTEGNEVIMFDLYKGIITGTSIEGESISLTFHHDAETIGAQGYKREHFTGSVGDWSADGLRRPAYRQGRDLTQEDLYQAVDAAVAFYNAREDGDG